MLIVRTMTSAFFASLAVTAPVAAGTRPDLAAQIEAHLNDASQLTFPMDKSVGYFEGDPIQPQRGYYVYAGLHSAHPFTFSIVVYKTAAQAAAMYERDVAHVHEIGGDGHAFKIVRSGRVLYMASTANAPSPDTPPVPVKAFRLLISLAEGL
jgi:hypothetical protein